MFFAIQSDTSGYLEDELYTLQKMLGEFPASLTSSFHLPGLRDTESLVSKEDIPVGTIEFTRRALVHQGYTDVLRPIEVPYFLQNDRFLNREYRIALRDDFNPDPSPFQSRILSYLDGGELVLASPSVAVDVITGERISQTNCILTDGEYSWSGSLGHYIRKYNLRLPEEFENKILKVIQSERGVNTKSLLKIQRSRYGYMGYNRKHQS